MSIVVSGLPPDADKAMHMLESFFERRGVLRRMRQGPLAEEIDGIATDLAATGYTRATVRRYLSLAATFSRYAKRVGRTKTELIDQDLVERFLSEIPVSDGMRSQARTALGHVVGFLGRRFARTGSGTVSTDADEPLLTAFDAHLRDVRGLQERSREGV